MIEKEERYLRQRKRGNVLEPEKKREIAKPA
jgi:hypothetical protein